MLGVGGVGLDMDVVAERAVRTVEELDDAKAFVDRVEQRPVALLAFGERGFRPVRSVMTAIPCALRRAFSSSSAVRRRCRSSNSIESTNARGVGVGRCFLGRSALPTAL